MTHGTTGGYTNHYCRCDACRAAQHAYQNRISAAPGRTSETGCATRSVAHPTTTGNDMTAVDLFSGARGWEALSGVDAVGIELDRWACATSEAAGLLTVRQDVTTINPRRFLGYDGLIASAPCQDWSTANQGTKRPDRKALVWVPWQWIDAIRPRWVALEQVPAVLVVWREYARWMRTAGYSVWCGILSAERYGVPQIRRRAVLIASLDRAVTPPVPTHRGFDTSKQRHEDDDLFGLPQAVNAFDEEITIDRRMNRAPVVGADRPAPTVTRSAGVKGQWLLERPARTVCGDRSPRWWYDDPDGNRGVSSGRLIRRTNQGDGKGGHVPAPDIETSERPAPTMTTGSGKWLLSRPATTVTSDPRVSPPGHHDGNGTQQLNATTLTVVEAARLQSFPADWPWQGNRTAVFSQIGNAIPPLLAAAILGQATT